MPDKMATLVASLVISALGAGSGVAAWFEFSTRRPSPFLGPLVRMTSIRLCTSPSPCNAKRHSRLSPLRQTLSTFRPK